jgi:ABC-type transport system involved in cytochrome c biogenesis permease subunit
LKSTVDNPMRQTISLLLFVLASTIAAPVSGGTAGELDWSTWQHLPVFSNGRMMPVNTFARVAAEQITNRANPRLSLEGARADDGTEPPDLDDSRKLFPDGESRRFTAAELLFSWLVEPQRWENVPFLIAEHEQLRKDVLGLPILSPEGQRLKYVSPWQLERSRKFGMHLMQLSEKQREAESRGQKPSFSALDEKVKGLYEAYSFYRRLTFAPASPGVARNRYVVWVAASQDTWGKLEAELKRFAAPENKETAMLVADTGKSLEKLITLSQKSGEVSLQELEPQVVAVRETSVRLAKTLAAEKDKIFQKSADNGPAAERQSQRALAHALAVGTADLARQVNEAHRALYDNGHTLRLVPALDPGALEKNRDPNDDTQPWLSVQTLLEGSDAVMTGYPKELVAQVRKAFRQVTDVYSDRSNPDRAAQFATAMKGFATAVRQLGEQVEPLRATLPIRQKDDELIAATAYPPPDYTQAEVAYYRLDPFFWSWIVGALAMTSLSLAFGVLRKPMFALGLVVLLAAQLLTVYGLGLRVHITGWAPVTNMFETVIFVALVVGVMGLWFTVLPMVWSGLTSAWRVTAIPWTPEASPLSAEQRELASSTTWNATSLALALPRLALAAAIFWLLAMVSYGTDGGYTIVKLLPRIDVGSSLPTVGNVIVWLVGLSMLGLAMWLLPRTILAGLVSVVTIPYTWIKQGMRKPGEQVLARKPFALVGAGVAFFAALVAYYAPAFDKNINPLMPVLRDNFWLTMHVLTITASYGAGALAWGLGNIALAYYLFGRYRDPVETTLGTQGPSAAGNQPTTTFLARRSPEVCDSLGTFNYKSMQVAVLLLAAGTILGGLWADVSWGRFWGWDSKEVWALVSLLIYLAILHGRSAGIFGNFGLAVGSVFGATAILMAWYGVNFVLGSGLHSYGEGTGGFAWVLAILTINWLFTATAGIRYYLETHLPLPPTAPQEASTGQECATACLEGKQ